MTDTRYVLQWSRPNATDRTRLERWIDLSSHDTRAQAEVALEDLVNEELSHDTDGLNEQRIVRREDTPLTELDVTMDLHVVEALALLRDDDDALPSDHYRRCAGCARCEG